MKDILLRIVLGSAALTAAPVIAQPLAPTTSASDQIDPARLEAARSTVNSIFPAGTYAKMMDGTLQQALGPIMDATGQMSLRQLAQAIGLKPEDVNKLGKGTLADIMQILDPAYKERMQTTMNVMMPAMAKMMTDFEPEMREGLMRAYARKFDKTQLDDMNRFFATPSGSAYASNAMLIQLDPEVMTRMTQAMPKVLERLFGSMPDIMKQVEERTATLPKPRKYEQLSDAERAKLADLLGVSVKDLKNSKK